jgi:hypothetical protein
MPIWDFIWDFKLTFVAAQHEFDQCPPQHEKLIKVSKKFASRTLHPALVLCFVHGQG